MKHPDTNSRLTAFSKATLTRENLEYSGTGGVSENNRQQGFVPAFLDTATGHVYRSRFQDGRAAPVHVLSGLPHDLFDSDSPPAIKQCVISGFLREDIFYSREQAAQAAQTGLVH